jgi:hypothetical protein
VRLVGETLREYEATTFPKHPWQGCELYLRRCDALGYLSDDGSGILVDVLGKNGDIVQDFPLTRQGLRYLRSQLRFKVRREPRRHTRRSGANRS